MDSDQQDLSKNSLEAISRNLEGLLEHKERRKNMSGDILKIDKHLLIFALTILTSMAGQVFGGVWWASSIEERQERLEMMVEKTMVDRFTGHDAKQSFAIRDQRIDTNEKNIDGIIEPLKEIQITVARMEDRQLRMIEDIEKFRDKL